MKSFAKLPAALVIGEYSANFDSSRLKSGVLARVGRSVIDTCACGIAGLPDEASAYAMRYAQSASGGGLAQSVVCWGRAERLPIELAAFYNGVAAHVLDYDDVCGPMRGHPSVAMLPALLALGETLDAPGIALAAAYVVGYDVMCKLGRVLLPEHYAKGWHSTASIGSIGCAVACAHILGLSAEQTAHAIGLAVSQAAGSRGNFGTHAKSFHAGHANTIGLRAALLAKQGFDASPDILEGPSGYMTLYGDGQSLADQIAALGSEPLEIERSIIDVKKYPMCYAVDRELDGILALREKHGLKLHSVRTIHVSTTRGALSPLIHQRPQTGLEAKFSMQYAMAAALEDGHIRLGSFRDEAVQRPDLQQFFPAVTAEESDPAPKPFWTTLEVTLQDGALLRRRVESPRGSAKKGIRDSELLGKLEDCVAWAKVPLDSDRFFDLAINPAKYNVRQLVSELSLPA